MFTDKLRPWSKIKRELRLSAETRLSGTGEKSTFQLCGGGISIIGEESRAGAGVSAGKRATG